MDECKELGPTYNLKCLHCAARYVAAARPSKKRQMLHLEYLRFYYDHTQKDVVNKIKELGL